ncbi:hypothetical protein QJS83_06485 [Bdellovibrio sp. 22V]|uniref:hypothetical protein n=1 Tax=Bdellovibrio sp. 22V TaxID=3044166 RepID=UPI0025429BBC|nr:hypothetical protein [Bdellovibrio sp. 22V]WII73517.1 hypothetical protein QJS83_06485 [Bdellovibrio sp. 22V]
MLKYFFLILPSLLLTNCSTISVDESKVKNLNNIGIVSVLDDKATLKYQGTTVFTNKEYTTNTASWDVNKVMTEKVNAELSQLGKKTVAVQLDARKIQSAKEDALRLKNLYLGNRYQVLQQYVLSEAEKQGAEHILVIHPTLNDNFPVHKAGYGFLCQSPMGKKGDLEGYTMIGAEMWNVKQRELEARVTISPEDAGFKTGKTCAEASKLSAEKMAAQYKEQMTALIQKAATLIVNRAGFTQTK